MTTTSRNRYAILSGCVAFALTAGVPAHAQVYQPTPTTVPESQQPPPQRPIRESAPAGREEVDGTVRAVHEDLRAITIEPEGGGALQTYALQSDTEVSYLFGNATHSRLQDIKVGDEVELQFSEAGGQRTARRISNQRDAAGSQRVAAVAVPVPVPVPVATDRDRASTAGSSAMDEERPDMLPQTATPSGTWAALVGMLALLAAGGMRLVRRRM